MANRNPPPVFRQNILLTVQQARRLLRRRDIKRVWVDTYSRLDTTPTGWTLWLPKSVFLKNMRRHREDELLIVRLDRLENGELLFSIHDYGEPDDRYLFDVDWSGRAAELFPELD